MALPSPKPLLQRFALMMLALKMLALPAALSAQERHYVFETLHPTFIHPAAYALETDEHGRLWFGTWGRGVFSYDGYNFTRYQSDSDDPNSLSNDRIFDLACDARQRVWMGTLSGLNCLDRRSGRVRRFQALGDSVFQFPAVYADRQGQVWAGGTKAILRYDEAQGSFAAVSPASPVKPARPNLFYEDSGGTLWVGRSDGLLRFLPGRRSYVQVPVPTEHPDDPPFRVMSILEDSRKHFWVGGFEGLLRFDPATGRAERPGLPDSLAYRHLTAMLEGPDGSLWLSFTGEGLVRWDPGSGECQRFRHNPLDPTSLPNDNIYALHLDRFGNLWISLDNQLARINLLPQPFSLWSIDDSDPFSRKNNVIRIAQDQRGGILVRSFYETFYLEKWGATPVKVGADRQPSPLVFIPDDFYKDRSGTVWAILDGLYRWDMGTRKFLYFPTPLLTGRVLAMEQDAGDDQVFWLGTLQGLNRYDLRSGEVKLFADVAPKGQAKTIGRIVDDGRGALWLDVSAALARFDKKTAQTELFTSASAPPHRLVNDEILDLRRGPDGTVWATTTGGITRVDASTGAFQNLTRHNGLSDNVAPTVLFDQQGNAWIVAPEHIVRRDAATGAMRTFNTAVMLQAGQWTRGRCELADGRLLFASKTGLLLLDPTQLKEEKASPSVVLVNLQVRDDTTRIGNVSPEFLQHVPLPYADNDLSFEWAGVQTARTGELQYACKMEGFDPDWVFKNTERKAVYTNLPHGHYTFRVKIVGPLAPPAGMAGGELAVEVIIAAPWWQSTWFRMMVVVLIGAAVYLVVHERETQRRLRQQKELAEQNARYKTRFLANMSHEIRTPLNAILGLSRLLTESNLEPKPAEFADAIRQSSENLLVIVNDVLDQVKIESGKFSFQQKPFDLRLIFRHLESTLGFKAEEKGLFFEIKMADETPALLIGDPVRLNQILTNLLGNAIKFTERGFVRLSVDHAQKSSGKRQGALEYCFVVEDSGIGIPPEKLAHVFESFQQADDDIAVQYGGTGLGLSITRQLVEQQGGRIELVSDPGEGTKATVSLPFTLQQESEARKATTAKRAPVFESLKILLVEDTFFNQMLATELLKSRIPGAEIELAENGQVALEKVQSADGQGFDLVLMDVKMPVLDGLEATRRLRALGARARGKDSPVPIIALTANAVAEELEKCRAAGMDAAVTKPIDAEELFATMKRVMNNE